MIILTGSMLLEFLRGVNTCEHCDEDTGRLWSIEEADQVRLFSAKGIEGIAFLNDGAIELVASLPVVASLIYLSKPFQRAFGGYEVATIKPHRSGSGVHDGMWILNLVRENENVVEA